MSLIRKHGAVLQAWACLDLVLLGENHIHDNFKLILQLKPGVKTTKPTRISAGVICRGGDKQQSHAERDSQNT